MLCNIYASNKADSSFFHGLKFMLGNAQVQIILAGDFNQVLVGLLVKSIYTDIATLKNSAVIYMLMENNGLIDVWSIPETRNIHFTLSAAN